MPDTATAPHPTAPPPTSRRRRRLPGFVLALPAWGWLIAFFIVPLGTIVWFSFGYKPGIFGTHANDVLSLDRYREAFSPTFFTTFENTLRVGVLGTLLCLVIGLPTAYWMAVKAPPQRKGLLLALVMVPYWTNFLIRTIGWQVILAPNGWASELLQKLHVISGPFAILNTRSAVLIGVVYNYLPLMILPLYVAFDRVGTSMREASKDLGANRWRTFTQVTLPLARPGIIAGTVLVFIPLMGDYVTATVLGGAKGNMVGQLVASQFQTAQNWALGSAMAVILILVIAATVVTIGLLLWLVSLPLKTRSRLVLEETP
ncbi:MAG: ABC transporter permease [Nocardioidaceae bacterium]